MTKIFLRSGSLDTLLALGENGQPLWLSALQLRETLRLKKQSQLADCLAIPQPNDAGNRLDWYSPVNGKVTSWAAASRPARAAALTQLRACQQVMRQLSEQAREGAKPSQRLFGSLLSKALQFPDEFYVYLVDGQPVITFWGFVSLDKRAHQDPLDCLQLAEEETPQPGLSRLTASAVPESVTRVSPAETLSEATSLPEAPAIMASAPVADRVGEPAAPLVNRPQAPPAVAVSPSVTPLRPVWRRYGWLLPVAAMLIAAGAQWLPLSGGSEPAAPQPTATATALPASVPATGSSVESSGLAAASLTPASAAPQHSAVAAKGTAMPAPDETALSSPLQGPAATVSESNAGGTNAPASQPPAPVSSSEPDAAAPQTEPEPDLPPPEKDDLVLPPDAVRLGSPDFLNGSWRVIVQQATPLTGRAPQLKYQLRSGRGTARIRQGDGVTCRADIEAAVMPSGNLVIKSRNVARCTDGTRYRMPELLCRQGRTGAARCNGSYNDSNNTVLPMTMKREMR